MTSGEIRTRFDLYIWSNWDFGFVSASCLCTIATNPCAVCVFDVYISGVLRVVSRRLLIARALHLLIEQNRIEGNDIKSRWLLLLAHNEWVNLNGEWMTAYFSFATTFASAVYLRLRLRLCLCLHGIHSFFGCVSLGSNGKWQPASTTKNKNKTLSFENCLRIWTNFLLTPRHTDQNRVCVHATTEKCRFAEVEIGAPRMCSSCTLDETMKREQLQWSLPRDNDSKTIFSPRFCLSI